MHVTHWRYRLHPGYPSPRRSASPRAERSPRSTHRGRFEITPLISVTDVTCDGSTAHEAGAQKVNFESASIQSAYSIANFCLLHFLLLQLTNRTRGCSNYKTLLWSLDISNSGPAAVYMNCCRYYSTIAGIALCNIYR